VAGREAAWAVDILLLHATADAVEHGDQPGRQQIDHSRSSALALEIATVDQARYPHIARLGDELLWRRAQP
jgi:hypothetical protein